MSTMVISSAASDDYKQQHLTLDIEEGIEEVQVSGSIDIGALEVIRD